jgi:hypothetical protein
MKDKSSTAVSSESEKKVDAIRNSGKKYKAGSLAEKANMVNSYNESNSSSKKQGKKG